MDADPRPTGVLVLRLWVDGQTPDDLRARVHGTSDVLSDSGQSTVLAGRARIVDYVAAWVEDYRRSAVAPSRSGVASRDAPDATTQERDAEVP